MNTGDLKQTMQVLDKACKEALRRTAIKLADDINEADVIPRKRGILEDTTATPDVSDVDTKGVAHIISNTPYARRLYFHPEYNFHRTPWEIHHRDGTVERFDGNPNARGEWFEPWETGERKHVAQEIFNEQLKQVLKEIGKV